MKEAVLQIIDTNKRDIERVNTEESYKGEAIR